MSASVAVRGVSGLEEGVDDADPTVALAVMEVFSV